MHDSEQEHSGITGCRVTYESTIFYNEANKFSIIVVKTSDPRMCPAKQFALTHVVIFVLCACNAVDRLVCASQAFFIRRGLPRIKRE